MQQNYRVPLLFSVVLIGLNLRPALAAISPLIGQIQQITGVSDGFFALLTTLPMLIMGVTALLLRNLSLTISLRAGCLVALVVIFIASISRLYITDGSILLVSAVLAGFGIGLLQVLIPGMIKVHFANLIGLAMGLYTSAIMTGAALAGGITPLLITYLSVSGALASWSILALMAVLVWAYVNCSGFKLLTKSNDNPSQSKSRPLIIRLCCLFGISTGAYTLALAWLPAYYQQLGMSAIASGGILSALTAAEIVAGLFVTFMVGKATDSLTALNIAVVALMLGLLMLIFNPLVLLYPCIICLGLGIGALFPLSLIVTLEHANNAAEAASLTALVQGVGYIIASIFPYIAGLLKGHLSDLSIAWWTMLSLCIPLFLLVRTFRSQTRLIKKTTLSATES